MKCEEAVGSVLPTAFILPTCVASIRKGGLTIYDFIVHADGPTLDLNKTDKGNRPMVTVRRVSDPDNTKIIAREAVWSGPSRCVHQQYNPIPGTKGRGVCWVEVRGPVHLSFDDGKRETIWP